MGKLHLDGAVGSRVEANIGALFDDAMSLDVVVDVEPADWFAANSFVGSDTTATIKFDYNSADSGGAPANNFNISNNGTNTVNYQSDQYFPDTRHVIEAHYVADNLSGNSQTNHVFDGTPIGFPISAIRPGIWTGVSEIWIGANSTGLVLNGDIYSVSLTANGLLVSFVDFTILAPGTTSFNDPQGNTWTLMGGATIVDSGGGAGQDDDEYMFFFN